MPQNSIILADNLNDLIGNPPGWLLKSGLSTLAIVVLCVLIITGFISYPDKISSRGIMTSNTPPIEHHTLARGFIDSIFVEQNQIVSKNDTLLYIKNQADKNDMLHLVRFIDHLELDSNAHYGIFPSRLRVGSLQPSYAALEQLYAQFKLLLFNKGTQNQINSLKLEINHLKRQYMVLLKQQELSAKELALRKVDYERSKNLFDEKVISAGDFEKISIELLLHEKAFVGIENQLIENIRSSDKINQRITELDQNRKNELEIRLLKINELVNSLKIKINEWHDQFFIVAQVDGQVSFPTGTVSNNHKMENDLLVHIIPEEENKTKYVSTVVPSNGIGKINIGNKSLIKVDGYPYKEFGVIKSMVLSVAALPVKTVKGQHDYEIRIALPDSTIMSTYNKNIPFKPNSSVSVEIITDDRSLLERVFSQFLNLLSV